MDASTYELLEITVEAGIAVATLSRPEKLNALSGDGHRELGRFLRDVMDDDSVLVAVLAGKGRAFSVGGDREWVQSLSGSYEERRRGERDARELIYAALDCDKPVVSALQGLAMGGGAAFALMADVIIAERGVRISDGHVAGGVAAGDGGALLWPLSVGIVRAKRFLLTSDWITAAEAERIGLVTEVVDDGSGLDRAMEYARRLAAGPQVAIQSTKRATNMHMRARVADVFELSLAYEIDTMGSPVVAESIAKAIRGVGGALIDQETV